MGVEKKSGIYIPGAKIPDEDYVRVLMLHKDGTCVDGIGNVFKVIPVPPHGRLCDLDGKTFPTPHRNPSNEYMKGWNACLRSVWQQPTIIQTSKEET